MTDRRLPASLRFALEAFLLLGTAPVLLAGSLNPPGPPAPTMKTIAEVEARTAVESLSGSDAALFEIVEAGSYYLTANLVGEPGKNGIVISSDDVTLDLNGFTLTGDSGGSGVAVLEPRRGIVVRNGTLRGWGEHGLRLYDCETCRAENLLVDQTGEDGSYASISLGPGAQVLDCLVRANTDGEGIQVFDGSRIERCTATSNFRGYGLFGENSLILRSIAIDNWGDGIFVQRGGLVVECVVQGSGFGIHVGSNATVRDNAVWVSSVGIQVDDGNNLVTGNHLTSSWDLGIRITAGSVGNVVHGNTVVASNIGFQTDPSGVNLLLSNSASGNTTSDYDGGGAWGEILDFRGGMTITAGCPWANLSY